MDDVAAALELAPPGRVIHVHRIGCLLNVLHLSVNAEMEKNVFMGPLGKSTLIISPRRSRRVLSPPQP